MKQQIKALGNKKSATGTTSLVSMYYPPGTQISAISSFVVSEQSGSTNIKSAQTRKAVQAALRTILARMPYLKNGKNGLAIFAGETLEAGKVEYYAIEPIEPVGIKTYVCDNRFHVDHLREMLETKDMLGIIVIDRGGATFASIRGSHLKILDNNKSFVPSKHGMGGQSAGRIERGIEILAREFYSKMAVKANHLFLGEENPISALVIGGPAMSKDEFVEHPSLDYRLKDMIFKIYDVGYTGEAGVRELLQRAGDDLGEYAMVKERQLFQQFLAALGEDEGKAIYGEKPARIAFERSAVDTVLFSDAVDTIYAKIQCSSCKKAFKDATNPIDLVELKVKVAQTACPNCKKEGTLSIVEQIELIDEFEQMAMASGASIEVISMQHEDGIMLYKTFGGIAALLRFPVDW